MGASSIQAISVTVRVENNGFPILYNAKVMPDNWIGGNGGAVQQVFSSGFHWEKLLNVLILISRRSVSIQPQQLS